MTKNIEDLLYRGDNLERMGEMSGRLREDSKKYRKAAVRINWELLLKQVRKLRHRTREKPANILAVRSFCCTGTGYDNICLVALSMSVLALPK